MEIQPKHIEWVVVYRLRTMLERTSQDEFEVTHAFALFSAICGWVRQRVGAFASDSEWPPGLDTLRMPITSSNWGLPNNVAWGKGSVILHTGGNRVEIELPNCSAWEFVVWVRNAMAHADHRGVQPIHEEVGKHKPHRTLMGFRFEHGECCTELSVDDMRRLGMKLAEVFCRGFSEGACFEQDATRGVLEKAA